MSAAALQIDDGCRTSDPDVYAMGECALHNGRIYGLVAPGYQMARVVAARLSGESVTFTGADMSTKLKLLGVEVASFGDAKGSTPGSRALSLTDNVRGTYKKLTLSEDGKTVLGGLLVGDSSAYGESAGPDPQPDAADRAAGNLDRAAAAGSRRARRQQRPDLLVRGRAGQHPA